MTIEMPPVKFEVTFFPCGTKAEVRSEMELLTVPDFEFLKIRHLVSSEDVIRIGSNAKKSRIESAVASVIELQLRQHVHTFCAYAAFGEQRVLQMAGQLPSSEESSAISAKHAELFK